MLVFCFSRAALGSIRVGKTIHNQKLAAFKVGGATYSAFHCGLEERSLIKNCSYTMAEQPLWLISVLRGRQPDFFLVRSLRRCDK
jgi:hypothetical protein